jgi:phospholipase/carboxylesterase
MEAIERQGKDLTYLMVYPDGYKPEQTYPMIILLHGYGANMYDLANLAPGLNQTEYVYACPNGPIIVDFGMGQYGYSWRPPRDGSLDVDPTVIERYLEGFFTDVMSEHGVSPKDAVLLGFSQGGGMTYRLGLTHPELFAGLVVLGIGFPDDMKTNLPEDRSLPIFIGHGQFDNIDRGRSARAFLEESGYAVAYHEYPIGHEISQDVLDDIAPWVRDLLNPNLVPD